MRGVILKNKKAGGGWGGGRSASPPNALGVVAFVRVACFVLFFRFFACSYGKRCGGERSFLKNKKAGGGLGGGRSASPLEGVAPSPPDALGVVAFVRVACLVLFFRFFLCSYGKRCGGERSHP